jgi:hypothetical protein
MPDAEGSGEFSGGISVNELLSLPCGGFARAGEAVKSTPRTTTNTTGTPNRFMGFIAHLLLSELVRG